LPRREPERTCIVTRTVHPAAELIRFVMGPDGTVVPDLKHRLPGRGVWVSARADAVAEAVRRKLFARGLKAPAQASEALVGEIEAALRRDLRQALALANKAGAVVTGFAKVEAAIQSGQAVALVHAAEAAPDGVRKLAAALRKRLAETISGFPIIDDLPGAELDLALGRSNVIHAGLIAGAGSEGCLACWRRLRSFSGSSASKACAPPGGDEHYDEPAGSERNE
jgi:predicted RNA-binding protein YlxR (DUF448 family)